VSDACSTDWNDEGCMRNFSRNQYLLGGNHLGKLSTIFRKILKSVLKKELGVMG
jgi:hypothetical protein